MTNRVRSILHAVLASLVLVIASDEALGFPAAPYFPLRLGTGLTYLDNGVPTTTVIAEFRIVNGYQTVVLSSDNGQMYYSNDANGIQLHQVTTLSPETNTTFSPAVKLAPADIVLGNTVAGSGTLSMSIPPLGTFAGTYSTTSRAVGFETVATLLGTFYALRADYTLTISVPVGAQTITSTQATSAWYVSGLGPVKDVTTVDGGAPETMVLQSISLSGTPFFPDTAPAPLSFPAHSNPFLSAVVTSNIVAVSDVNLEVTTTILGGSYSVNGGPFTAEPGTVRSGDTVALRVVAASTPSETTCTTLTIGIGSGQFCAANAVVVDTTPDPFVFPPRTGAALGATATSSAVAVSGINSPAPISISGGSYSINGGPFTIASGTIENGSTVAVRVETPGRLNTQTCSSVTVGGVTSQFCATTLTPAALLNVLTILLD